jgi:hypothetical protein
MFHRRDRSLLSSGSSESSFTDIDIIEDDDKDLSLVQSYLRHSQLRASSSAEELEREHKENNDGWLQQQQRRRSVDLQPGFAPASFFSATNIRNSTRLEGMRDDWSGSSAGPSQPLRVSQLIGHDQTSGPDLRVSAINEQVQSFQQILEHSQMARLSPAQTNVISIHLGNFGEMISKLELLIEQHIDEPERLGTLLMLHENITDAIKAYEATVVAQYSDPEPADDIHFNYHAWALEQEQQQEENKEESEEEDDLDEEDDEDHEGKEEKECVICMDDFWWPGKRGYELKCGCLYCKACLRSNYDVLINDGKVLKLVCPNPTCAAAVDEEDLKNILTNKQFVRYQQFFLLASLRNDPTVRWCPKPGCETAAHGSEEDCHMKCATCSTEFCWKCNLEWHEGISCERAKRQAQKGKKKLTRAEKKAERYIKKNARPCPQCKTPIQKTEGCNHMTCQGCRYEFCWICMGRFTGYDHFSTGRCRGLQNWSSNWTKYGAYAGIGVAAAAGVVVVTPIVIGLGIPALAIGLPIYGAYKLAS